MAAKRFRKAMRKNRNYKSATVVMNNQVQTNKIRKLERKVTRMSKQRETKYIDTSAYGASIAYNSSVFNYDLCPVPQGDGIKERIGDKIDPFFVSIKGTFYSNSTAPETIRLMLIKCKKGNGFVPSIGNTSTGLVIQSQGTSLAPWNPLFYSNKTEFTVLYDRMFTIQGTGTSMKQFHWKINKKISGPIEFVAETTTAEGGQLYLLAISSTPSGSTPPSGIYSSRVYYKD